MYKKKRNIVLAVLLVLVATPAFAQVGVKTNLLYDATTTLNLGVEVGIAPKWSLELSANYNPWKWNNEMRLRHLGVQPELRYWFCEKFNGHFLGLHAHWAKFNIGNLPDRSYISENMQRNRYEGNLWGGGLSYGYQYPLGKHWSLEGVIGLGFARIHKEKYPCARCGTKMEDERTTYWGPTKAAVNLIYIIH